MYMKFLNKILLAFCAVLALTACERTYDVPPLNVPHYDGPAPNTNIAQLLSKYTGYTDTKGVTIEDDLYLRATVSGNDESGNIYKGIYVDDGSNGLLFKVDQTGMANLYRVGQDVVIKLKGLAIGSYGGMVQIGAPSTDPKYSTGFIPGATLSEVFALDGEINNSAYLLGKEFNSFDEFKANAEKYMGRVITINGVSFVNGGSNIFAPKKADGSVQSVNESIGGWTNLVVRTSSAADFANETLPSGKGSLTGMLTKYRDTYQLIIRTFNDVHEFDGKSIDGNTDTPTDGGTEAGVYLNAPFTAQLEKGFTENYIKKSSDIASVWTYSSKYTCLIGKGSLGKDQNKETESRYESPEIDLTKAVNPVATFNHVAAYLGNTNAADFLTFQVQIVGEDSWKTLPIPTYTTTGWDLKPSGNIDLKDYVGKKIKVGFLYKSTTATGPTWEINNLKVGEKDAVGSSDTAGGSTGDNSSESTTTNVKGGTLDPTFSKVFSVNWLEPKTNTLLADYVATDAFKSANPGLEVENNSDYKVSVRNVGGSGLWFSANQNIEMTLKNMKTTGKNKGTLEIGLGTNGEQDLKAITITLNGKTLTLPGETNIAYSDRNKPFTYYIENVTLQDANTLNLKTAASTNLIGIRVYQIVIHAK